MNKSFFKGMLAGSILGTFISMLNTPQMKPTPKTVKKLGDTSVVVQSGAKKVLKGISKSVSDIIK